MTTDFLKYKVQVNEKVMQWVDKYSRRYPDLFIWKKSQGNFLEIAEGLGSRNIEKFSEKH